MLRKGVGASRVCLGLVLGTGLAPFPGDSEWVRAPASVTRPESHRARARSHPGCDHPSLAARAQGAKPWHPDGLPKAKNGVPVEGGAVPGLSLPHSC